MKRTVLALCALLLVANAFAADPVDHPLVGRYPDATIQHQEVSNFGQYTILVGKEETETVQGEVWMTLYRAPDDSSTFSVHATYRDFLEAEGYTILVSCEPGSCEGITLTDAYWRAPFANHGNGNHSAPLTHSNGSARAYISAMRESGGTTVYVSIAIAAGWYSYPQYKLDVVEVATNTASIVSVGTREEEPVVDAAGGDASGTAAGTPPSTTAAPGGTLFSGTGSFRTQAGAGMFAFSDPDFAGGLVDAIVAATSVGTTMGGFRNLYGPFAEVSWFLNQNLGILADVTHFTISNNTTIGDTTFDYAANMTFIQAGAMARLVGDAYPVTLGLGFSAGMVIVEFYDQRVDNVAEANSRYYLAEDFFPAFRYSAELTIPVVSIGRLSAALQYTFVPARDLTFEHDGGSAYSIVHYEPNLGGFTLRIGLVAEL